MHVADLFRLLGMILHLAGRIIAFISVIGTLLGEQSKMISRQTFDFCFPSAFNNLLLIFDITLDWVCFPSDLLTVLYTRRKVLFLFKEQWTRWEPRINAQILFNWGVALLQYKLIRNTMFASTVSILFYNQFNLFGKLCRNDIFMIAFAFCWYRILRWSFSLALDQCELCLWCLVLLWGVMGLICSVHVLSSVALGRHRGRIFRSEITSDVENSQTCCLQSQPFGVNHPNYTPT